MVKAMLAATNRDDNGGNKIEMIMAATRRRQ